MNRKLLYVLTTILSFGVLASCKHEAGILDKCLGKDLKVKVISIMNSDLSIILIDTTTLPIQKGIINFDTAFVSVNLLKKKSPFLGSIDGGKSWKVLPYKFSNLDTGKYFLQIKDADSCTSATENLTITY